MARLRSLLFVEQKILEAEYFVDRLPHLQFEAFVYELNAFLSAARSVTFLLQKEMKGVPGFDDWWKNKSTEMSEDPVMKFFKKSRNISQKEGTVAVEGWGTLANGDMHMRYIFPRYAVSIPGELVNRNVEDCCREHLGKLANIVLQYSDAFPFYCCPRRAMTSEGLNELGLTFSDIEQIVGLPSGWTDAGDIAPKERLRILQEEFDGVDFQRIRMVATLGPGHRQLEER